MDDPRELSEISRWECVDCKKDTFIENKDYYMVTDKIWKTHGVGNNMLCMDCMEERLGHKLKPEDIASCPLNIMFNNYTSNILKSY